MTDPATSQLSATKTEPETQHSAAETKLTKHPLQWPALGQPYCEIALPARMSDLACPTHDFSRAPNEFVMASMWLQSAANQQILKSVQQEQADGVGADDERDIQDDELDDTVAVLRQLQDRHRALCLRQWSCEENWKAIVSSERGPDLRRSAGRT